MNVQKSDNCNVGKCVFLHLDAWDLQILVLDSQKARVQIQLRKRKTNAMLLYNGKKREYKGRVKLYIGKTTFGVF